MRTKKQKLYDWLYYTVEYNIFSVYNRFQTLAYNRGTKFGLRFWKYYWGTVVPYWKQFGIRPKAMWAKYYLKINGDPDPRYIPDDIFYQYVIPFFDDPMYERQMEDKNMYNLLFPRLKRPETVYKHFATTAFSRGGSESFCEDDFTPIAREDALARLLNGGRMIIKPTRDTGGGSDVKLFSSSDGAEAIEKIMDEYAGMDYIVQKAIVQHKSLAEFNPSSVNTLRIVTMVFHGQTKILSAILRIGHAGSDVDNYSKGGYAVNINPDGTLYKKAVVHESNGKKDVFVEQTENGKRFEGASIPSWDKLYEIVIDAAEHLPHHKLVGWDFSIDETGDPVLIEFNCHIGQNQENCGPTFADQTEEVLSEVFRARIDKRRKRRRS